MLSGVGAEWSRLVCWTWRARYAGEIFNRIIQQHQPDRCQSIADSDADGIADEWEIRCFGNLTTATASTDYDHDGQSDYAEYISGTDPKNASSYLLVQTQPGATGFLISWPSKTNRTYTLERSTNLLSGFTVLQSAIAATPPMNSTRDLSSTNAQTCYYRIKLTD